MACGFPEGCAPFKPGRAELFLNFFLINEGKCGTLIFSAKPNSDKISSCRKKVAFVQSRLRLLPAEYFVEEIFQSLIFGETPRSVVAN